MHMSSIDDIEQEAKKKEEADRVTKIQAKQKNDSMQKDNHYDCEEPYKYNEISYLKDYKKEINFTYMQSMILISAFVAGSNKESTDLRLFEVDRSKYRKHQGNANK